MKHTFLLIAIALLTACTVQKRTHRSGFHIEWKKRYAHQRNDPSEVSFIQQDEVDMQEANDEAFPALESEDNVGSVVNTAPVQEMERDSPGINPEVSERIQPVNDDTVYLEEEDVVMIKEVSDKESKSYRAAWAIFSIFLLLIFFLGGTIILVLLSLFGTAEIVLALVAGGVILLFILIQLLFLSNTPERKFDRKIRRAEKKGKQVVILQPDEKLPRRERKKQESSTQKRSGTPGDEVLIAFGVLLIAIFGAVLLF